MFVDTPFETPRIIPRMLPPKDKNILEIAIGSIVITFGTRMERIYGVLVVESSLGWKTRKLTRR